MAVQGSLHVLQSFRCFPRLLAPLSRIEFSNNIQSDSTKKVPKPPKRPIVGFIKYVQNNHESVKANNPDFKPTQVSTLLGKMWKEMPASEKKEYKDESKEMMTKWKEHFKDFKKSLTEEEKHEIKEEKEIKKNQKEKRGLTKLAKEMNRPKRSVTAFSKFVSETYSSVDSGDDGFMPTQRMKAIAKKWKALTDDEKQPYVTQARLDGEKYQKELLLWEQKMIKLGHIMLVRRKTLRKSTEN